MEKARRKRRGATAWRRVLTRYAESGLTAAAFCEREGISSQSLYHWRTRLGRVPDQPLTEKVAGVTHAENGFIDLGALRAGSSRLELCLDLGGGVRLHLVRDLVDKFAYHLPLYRQHQRLTDAGITVSRPWLTHLAQRSIGLLEPIHAAQFASIPTP